MKNLFAMAVMALSLMNNSFASESVVDAKCGKAQGFNAGITLNVIDNGKTAEGMNLKKLVHTSITDTSSEETTIVSDLMCSIDEGSYICFSAKTTDKFFILATGKSVHQIQLMAQTKKVEKIAKSLGLDKINGDLGEVYSVADLTCKFE